MVGIIHAIFLNGENRGVHLSTTAIEIGGMNMNHQWLACHLLGMNASRISEPVVRVNHVAIDGAGYNTCHDGVIIYFLEQVVGVATREFYTPQVVSVHIVKIAIDVVAQVKISAWVQHFPYSPFHIVPVHIAPCHGSGVGTNDASKVLGLIAPGLGNDKSDVHVATLCHALGKTKTCCSKPPQDVRRKFPAKH